MNNAFQNVVLLFFIYGFLGWCAEVAFAACKNGRFVNRGFLNGPICPIYGFGLIGVVLMLRPMQGNLLMLYIGSFLLTSLIELITGFLLEKLFHAKWWDYSKMPLNIGGYVCLLFSLIWGAACLGIVEWIHPLIQGVVEHMPNVLVIVLDSVFVLLLIIDLAATLATIRKLNDRLEKLSEIAAEIHRMSDGIGSGIADKTLSAKEHLDDIGAGIADKTQSAREHIDELRENSSQNYERKLAELRARFDAIVARQQFGHRRLLEAFPNLKSTRHDEAMARLRERLQRKRK